VRASACRFALAALAFLAAAAPASAQSSPDSLGWHLTAAAGCVQTSGNVGFDLRFDHQPVPGFKKTDTTFTSGIQLTL